MIIECIACSKKFEIKDGLMPPEGSKVRCGACGEIWFYHPKKALEENENSNQDMSFLSNTESELDNLQSPIEKEDQEISDEPDQQKEINKDEVSNFKIFGNDTTELPEKEQMDKNLDELILGRDKNKSFFSKLFKKKDRISDAKKFFAKKDKKEQTEREKNKNPNSQFTRLLIYLLFVLVVVLSIFLTPYRTHLEMAYPSLSTYFDIVSPIYNKFMSYLIL
ncbi:zinc-ribbon domain-containing protein [Candidatus Pelagibacter sp.]|jgi:predicted Zn finger-like uncharacterized protein|nr:zinc-ribbon domain-containing protein [Candidatus Pelagibacter sp.]|tara:strand:- start:1110 stop:1772 length:663 start_codon:yes stop_codon:yes gene_type:complete